MKKVDVRIIAATNRNLEQEISQGTFRSDLYFRLHVFPVTVPPLRERKEDILALAYHFTQKFSRQMGKRITGIDPKTEAAMLAYDWPGNIRELKNLVERAVITSDLGLLRINIESAASTTPETGVDKMTVKTLVEGERELIMAALQASNGRIRGENGAASLLDIKPTTLEARIKKIGIKKEHVISG